MHLSEKLKLFSQFFPFLESTLNIERLRKKSEPQSSITLEVIDSERRGYLNASKVLFLKTFSQ